MKKAKPGAQSKNMLETAAIAIGSTLGNLAKTVGLVEAPKKTVKKKATKAATKPKVATKKTVAAKKTAAKKKK